jgi:hypothetical protein
MPKDFGKRLDVHAGECGGDPTQAPMSAETVEAVINIAEAASANAVEAYLAMGADGAVAGAKYLLKRLKAAGLGEISKRDLHDRCKGKFPTAESMEPALAMLADVGYVRIANKATGGRGRPGKMIFSNPYEQK